MRLSLRDDLPFVSIGLSFEGRSIEVQDVLVDTGSASTLMAADAVAGIHLTPLPTDDLRIIRGVGGGQKRSLAAQLTIYRLANARYRISK